MSRRWLRLTLLAAALVVTAFALRGRLPEPAMVLGVLRAADPYWLAAAVLAQFLSQAAFAVQQRTLLAALGARMSVREALALTYSRSAMSLVMPAGGAVSAAFAMRQYRRHGASTAVAATVMLLSGLASAAGLALLYTGTIGPTEIARLGERHAVPLLAVTLGAAAAVTIIVRPASRRRRREPLRLPPRLDRAWQPVRHAVREARSVPLRRWIRTLAVALLNWLLDLLCLIAVARACQFPLSWYQLATVYLAVQVVRQIPLTPGGIGLIEASLLGGFLTAGAPQSAAAAVVLGYRLISCWLILPGGLLAYLRLTRTPRTAVPAGAPITAGEAPPPRR